MGVRIYLSDQGCLQQNLCRDRVERVASIPFPSYDYDPPFPIIIKKGFFRSLARIVKLLLKHLLLFT